MRAAAMHRRHIPLKFIAGVAVLGALLVAAALMVLSGDTVLRVAGIVLGTVCLGWWLLGPVLDARSSERHVENFPELLHNEAIGQPVTAVGDFRPGGRRPAGRVRLRGEQWRAECLSGDSPRDGERLRVRGREGLTLLVAREDAAAHDRARAD